MHCLFLWCICWNCNRFLLLLVTCPVCVRMWCRQINVLVGLGISLANDTCQCLLVCSCVHKCWSSPLLWCIKCTKYTRHFKMCRNHNLLPEGRMSYTELFLMFFSQIFLIRPKALREKKSGFADTWWLLFWIQGLMFVNYSSKFTHLTGFPSLFLSCFIRSSAESWTITEAVKQSSNSSLQILQCTFFNCKINLLQAIDPPCKWNSGKLQIVCEISLSAYGAQCSVILQIVSPLWKGLWDFFCFFQNKDITFGLVF